EQPDEDPPGSPTLHAARGVRAPLPPARARPCHGGGCDDHRADAEPPYMKSGPRTPLPLQPESHREKVRKGRRNSAPAERPGIVQRQVMPEERPEPEDQPPADRRQQRPRLPQRVAEELAGP